MRFRRVQRPMNKRSCASCLRLCPLAPRTLVRLASHGINVSHFYRLRRNVSASWTQQWRVMSGPFGPLLAVGSAMSPPFLGAISACTRTRCCMCSVQISKGSVSVVFLSGSRVCPQTIGKTTKKKLNGDVTTNFPPVVLSSSDYTTENVRRQRATPDFVRPFTLENLGLGLTLLLGSLPRNQ